MATVFTTNTYEGRYLKLTLEQRNEYIDWTLESLGGIEKGYSVHDLYIVINGQVVYGKNESYVISQSTGTFPAYIGSTGGSVYIGVNSQSVAVIFRGTVYTNSDDNENGGVFEFKTVRNCFINVNSTMKQGLIWVNENGTWKKGRPWIKDNNTWKKGGA